MSEFTLNVLKSFVGVIIAYITVLLVAVINNQTPDEVVGWVALGIAGASAMTKKN